MPTGGKNVISSGTSLHHKRVYVQIREIKGEDKIISSRKEAMAILAIPNSDVVFTDNPMELPLAKREAMYYLEHGNSNLATDLVKVYNWVRQTPFGNAIAGYYNKFIINSGSNKSTQTAYK